MSKTITIKASELRAGDTIDEGAYKFPVIEVDPTITDNTVVTVLEFASGAHKQHLWDADEEITVIRPE